jgi:hypothetical protein
MLGTTDTTVPYFVLQVIEINFRGTVILPWTGADVAVSKNAVILLKTNFMFSSLTDPKHYVNVMRSFCRFDL